MWILYALLSAFGVAGSDAAAKVALQRDADSSAILFVRQATVLLLLLPLLFRGVPGLDATFWWLHLPWIPLETTALYLYIHAIRISPLSLTLPFLSLTPLFLAFLAPIFMTGENVGTLGAAGIGCIVIGSYVLHLRQLQRGWLEPFKAILRERGTWMMIIVAFLYSLTSMLGKKLIAHSDPWYFAVHFAVVMTLVLAPLGLRGRARQTIRDHAKPVGASALFFAVMIVGHMLALSLAPVAYVISLKRCSGAFGVLFGRIVFSETATLSRLSGALLMVLGGLLIVLESQGLR